MQALQLWKKQDAIFLKLLTRSKDKELNDELPKFISWKTVNEWEFVVTAKYDTVIWYITRLCVIEREKTIDNKVVKKETIHIEIYNEHDCSNIIVESWYNSTIKWIISRLASVDFEKTKVSLIVWKNTDWYSTGLVRDFDTQENIPFAEDVHPKKISDEIKATPMAQWLLLEDEDTYKDYIANQSDKAYKAIIWELNKLPKYAPSIGQTSPIVQEIVIKSDDDELTIADLEEAQQALATTPAESKPHPFDNVREKLKNKSPQAKEEDDDKLPF